jgi:hypothetical protein
VFVAVYAYPKPGVFSCVESLLIKRDSKRCPFDRAARELVGHVLALAQGAASLWMSLWRQPPFGSRSSWYSSLCKVTVTLSLSAGLPLGPADPCLRACPPSQEQRSEPVEVERHSTDARESARARACCRHARTAARRPVAESYTCHAIEPRLERSDGSVTQAAWHARHYARLRCSAAVVTQTDDPQHACTVPSPP